MIFMLPKKKKPIGMDLSKKGRFNFKEASTYIIYIIKIYINIFFDKNFVILRFTTEDKLYTIRLRTTFAFIRFRDN